MARKVLGVDDAIHGAIKGLQSVFWHHFDENATYQYYYAENKLYVIKDAYTGALTFVKADSPHKAWQAFLQEKGVI